MHGWGKHLPHFEPSANDYDISPDGKELCFVSESAKDPGTDFNAVERGAVSITPLQVDLTHGGQIPLVGEWIAKP